jgi:hypothetical protein
MNVPFATTGDAEDLVGAVTGVAEAGLPLWHLAFLNPKMARAEQAKKRPQMCGAFSLLRS